MERCEVLSPVGDLTNFYVAIKSGADAVYLGLNKFNARMRAENISEDNIAEVVRYAHLKGVKVYVTLNTLVSTSEMNEVMSLVDICVSAGVDAFIVQDYGIISVLKRIYPDIELHGSTQLGVHNVRGARVAKKLGLTRVVLSREVTIEDIREIKQNVDIELEVFVQGAMCVCFSGNCYLSSLKYGASGNRGECKQLCRLPYKMESRQNTLSGYMLSPRDNCMISRLKELMEIGVSSFKIEGRLRRKGYVNIATRSYRDAVDSILKDVRFDETQMKRDLKKVFSRGDFIEGYFNGNNIIDYNSNNHLGEQIGKVVSCERFKDLYRITLDVDCELHSGDGLKIISNNEQVAFGVGNVDRNDKYIVVYGKNYVFAKSVVYRVLDVEFENELIDRSKYRPLNIKVSAHSESPFSIEMTSGGFSYTCTGSVCSTAKNKPVTKDNIISQVSKLGEMKDCFVISDIDCDLGENVFIPLSDINSVRRECLEGLVNVILERRSLNRANYDSERHCGEVDFQYNRLAMVDESANIESLNREYEALILCPRTYTLNVVRNFHKKYKKVFDGKLILNLPIIALKDDLKIIDEIVSYCRDVNIVLLANNIYGLDYLDNGLEVWAGSNMNICNEYADSLLRALGVERVVGSIEKWCGGLRGTYRMGNGRRVLMTLAHCPYKTLNHSDCSRGDKCTFAPGLSVRGEKEKYLIRRYRIAKCYFELIDEVVERKSGQYYIDDRRCDGV